MKYIKKGKRTTTGYCVICRIVCSFNCTEVNICPEVLGEVTDEVSD